MYFRIIALLLVLQCFAACQLEQEKILPSAADVVFQSNAAGRQDVKSPAPAAANIVFQSSDNGQTWQDVSAGLPADLLVGRAFVNNGEIFLGSYSSLYHKSTPLAAPNPSWGKEFFFGDRISNVSPGRFGAYASCIGVGFFQNIPGTSVWMAKHNSLKDKMVYGIVETPDKALLVGSESGIYKSDNDGNTWKQVFSEDIAYNFFADSNVLFSGTNKGVLRSTDGGEHWDRVLTKDGVGIKTARIEDRLVTIIGGYKKNTAYTSTDGGKNWLPMQGVGLPDDGVYHDFEQLGKTLFCSHTKGIFRSLDNGKTWELILPSKEMTRFDLAISGNVIIAVPVTYGC